MTTQVDKNHDFNFDSHMYELRFLLQMSDETEIGN